MLTRLLRAGLLIAVAAGLAVLQAAPPLTSAATPDPGTTGPLAVTSEEYDYGDSALTFPPDFPFPVEMRAAVYHPTDLSGGPYPLIVFLHGRHVTCYSGTDSFLEWPCAAGELSIPSYKGYDYIGQVLASNGYIVVSVSANGINANDDSAADLGALARAKLIQAHLDKWKVFSTSGAAPFGTKFVGKVDLQHVGTMGHSRGGEGIVRHFLYNQSLGSPYGITAVLTIAPTDFSRFVIINVPLDVLLPYCDGDVSDLQGVHFYDDARYNVPGDSGPKHTLLAMGANHNYFNRIWTPGEFPAGTSTNWTGYTGGTDDPQCGTVAGNQRLSPAEQRGTGLAYVSAFMRAYVGNEDGVFPYLTGDAAPPPSAQTTSLFESFHPADNPALRRTHQPAALLRQPHHQHAGRGGDEERFHPVQPVWRESSRAGSVSPERGPGPAATHDPEPPLLEHRVARSQLRGGWSAASAFYDNDLPAGSRDVSGFQAIQFRVSVNFADARNPAGQARDFSIVLADGSGHSASAQVSSYSGALYYPPGVADPVPKILLNTVRIPLTAFAGVDLTDIRSVQLRFDQSSSGALLLSDLAFAAGISGGGPPPSFQLAVSRVGTGSGKVGSTPAGITLWADCSESYPAGTSVLLTATAAAGSTFAGWSGACTGTTNPCSLTMNAASSVSARFTKSGQHSADLALSMTDAPDPVVVGSQLTYTLRVTNNGPSGTSQARVVDTLPRSVTVGSAQASQGSCVTSSTTPVQVTCQLGSVPSGGSATITIRVRPRTAGTIRNMATVSAADVVDPNSANNTAAVSSTVTAH